ncbi:MAG: hypothetical protein ACLTQN_01835 [Blautia massiliensis (ex Durand et al. 2017)]
MTYPINAIIFDIDGVLLDSLFIWKELGRRFIVKSWIYTCSGYG